MPGPRPTSRIPRLWTRSKNFAEPCGGNPREARTRLTGRGLVPRRDAGGSKEQAHLSLGQEGVTPSCRPRSTDSIDLPVRCGLPRTWWRRRLRAAGLQLRSHAAPSRRDRNQSRSRSTPFSSLIRLAGMAPRPSTFQATSRSCSSRHTLPNSTAKKIFGNSCGRTGFEPNFQILRRHRRSLLLRLEHTHRPTLDDHVHRAPRLSSRRALNLRIGYNCPSRQSSLRGSHAPNRNRTTVGQHRHQKMCRSPSAGNANSINVLLSLAKCPRNLLL